MLISSQRIIFLIVFTVIGIIVNDIKARKIREAPTVEEATNTRSSLKWFRIIWPIIGGFGYFVLIPIIWESNDFSSSTGNAFHIIGGLFLFVLLLAGVLPAHSGETTNLTVSDETKASYLSKHEKFALYLRAFHNDDYSEKNDRNDSFLHRSIIGTSDLASLSEHLFVAELEKIMSVAAIGMTREIEQPEGACRVYVGDDTWQEDVVEIMGKATLIFLRVEDRESCLWELKQSLSMREKTIYIVDDAKSYADIVRKYPQLEVPAIPECYTGFEHLLIKWDNDRYVMLPFENTIQDYRQIVSDISGFQKEKIEKGMFESIYSGLQKIWVSPDDSPDDIRRRISRLMEAKRQLCPIIYYDFITLTDCYLEDNRMVFRFETDDVDEVQTEQLFGSLGNDELQLADNNVLCSLVEYLQIDICYSCLNRLDGNSVEYVAKPFVLEE